MTQKANGPIFMVVPVLIASCGGRGFMLFREVQNGPIACNLWATRDQIKEQVSESLRGIGNNELHEVKGIFDSRASIL